MRAIAERLYGEGWRLQSSSTSRSGSVLSSTRSGTPKRGSPSAPRDRARRRDGPVERCPRVHGDAAEVAIALGDTARAREIAELLEEHGRRTDHRWSAAVAARTWACSARGGRFRRRTRSGRRGACRHERLPIPTSGPDAAGEGARSSDECGSPRGARLADPGPGDLRGDRRRLWAARAADELNGFRFAGERPTSSPMPSCASRSSSRPV